MHNNHRKRGRYSSSRDSGSNNIVTVPCCSVCKAEKPSYKCPKCRAPYCSIKCCKTHKESECKAEDNDKQNGDTQQREETTKYGCASLLSHETTPLPAINRKANWQDLELGYNVTPDMIDKLHASSYIQNEVTNDAGLQQLITRVATASNNVSKKGKHGTTTTATIQQNLLNQYKQEYPKFAEFCDKMLVVTGILTGPTDNVKEWLESSGNNNNSTTVLTMVPVERKKRRMAEAATVAALQKDSDSSDDTSTDSDTSEDNSSSDDNE